MQAADLAALDREPYISLVTYRRSGVGVPTPVWFAVKGGRLWAFSESRAGKIKRLRNDPRARFAACNVRGRVHGSWHEARARVVAGASEQQAAYAALRAKYGWQMRLLDLFSRLGGRIGARAVIEIEPVSGATA
jgi:PPOX class probable F420-dependent enzyme